MTKKVFSIILAGCMAFGVMVSTLFGMEGKNVGAEEAFTDKEILTPYWEGTISYLESVLAVEEEDGSIAPIDLLYPIEEILVVKNASLNVIYEAGKDYSTENGKLIVHKTGSIPRMTYAEFHPTTGTNGFEDRDGGYVQWQEGAWYHSKQIVVTYRHAEGYDGYIPESKGYLLPNTHEKLQNDEQLNVLVYGDSISTGANSSGHPMINAAPNMPIYPEMFIRGLKRDYQKENINLINEAVGGTDSAWGVSNVRFSVFEKYDDIDFAIIAFGMNDISVEPENFSLNISRLVRALKNKYDGIEIVLIATMLPNYQAINFWGKQDQFYDVLKTQETEGVAVLNMTGVHKSLLEVKRYADMTGNNINHPNDYFARVYAQSLLKTLVVDESLKGDENEPSAGDSSGTSSDNGGNSDSSSSTTDSSEEEKGCNGSATCGILFTLCAVAFGMKKLIDKEKNKK